MCLNPPPQDPYTKAFFHIFGSVPCSLWMTAGSGGYRIYPLPYSPNLNPVLLGMKFVKISNEISFSWRLSQSLTNPINLYHILPPGVQS